MTDETHDAQPDPFDDPAVRDEVFALARKAFEDNTHGLDELPDDIVEIEDPRATMDMIINMGGVVSGVWTFGEGPKFYGTPVATGILAACDDPSNRWVFTGGYTQVPFGFLVTLSPVENADAPPLRRLWVDGEELLRTMVGAGIAHATGEGLEFVGEGPDPLAMPDLEIPDAIGPDDLGSPDA